jgi:hypothetical protein
MAKPPKSSPPGPLASGLSVALATIARHAHILNPWDESDDDFHAFAQGMAKNVALSADSFRAALGIGERYEIALGPAADSLAELAGAGADWGQDVADGWALIAKIMNATLTDVSLAWARGKGVIRVRVWLFGRDPNGDLVGLRSMSTET